MFGLGGAWWKCERRRTCASTLFTNTPSHNPCSPKSQTRIKRTVYHSAAPQPTFKPPHSQRRKKKESGDSTFAAPRTPDNHGSGASDAQEPRHMHNDQPARAKLPLHAMPCYHMSRPSAHFKVRAAFSILLRPVSYAACVPILSLLYRYTSPVTVYIV